MGWILEELVFGIKAYVVALMYFVASVVGMVVCAIRLVFAPLVFDGNFKITPVFRGISTFECCAFLLAHRVLELMQAGQGKDVPETSSKRDS